MNLTHSFDCDVFVTFTVFLHCNVLACVSLDSNLYVVGSSCAHQLVHIQFEGTGTDGIMWLDNQSHLAKM